MSALHTIALDRLNTAIRLFVRGFGSSEAEVEAVAGPAPPASDRP